MLETQLENLKRQFLAEVNADPQIRSAVEGNLYVNLQVSAQLGGDPIGPLGPHVRGFIDSATDKVFLLQGNAGSGKSLFALKLAWDLWQAWTPGSQNPVPLFISLPWYWNRLNQLVLTYLADKQITADQIKNASFKKVFIFDGYDEINGHENLYQANELYTWQNTKVIVTCRSHYLGANYLAQFAPRSPLDHSVQVNFFKEGYVAAFSADQQSDYISQFAASQELNPNQWTPQTYREKLDSFYSLQQMAQEPFSLKLILSILPSLPTAQDTPLTRYVVYEKFIAQWFQQESQKIGIVELTQNMSLGAHPTATAYTLDVFQRFSQEIALLMFQENCLIVAHHVPWFAALFQGDATRVQENRIGLKGSPLKALGGDGKTFVHKSFMEYFVARCAIEEAKKCVGYLTSAQSRDLRVILSKCKVLTKYHLPHRDKDRAIINFIADRIRFDRDLQNVLFHLIQLSAGSIANGGVSYAVGAANAATFLNYAGVSFSNQNFRGARLPKADLSQAICERTDFRGADLREIDLNQSWLRGAQFDGANLGQTEFGELAPFKGAGEPVWVDPQGRRCAFYSEGNKQLSVYNLENNEVVSILTCPKDTYTWSIFFTQDGRLCAMVFSGRILLWDVASGKERPSLNFIDKGKIRTICFSPDGSQMAIAIGNYALPYSYNVECLYIWDVLTNQEIARVNYEGFISSLCFSPDGHKVAGGLRDDEDSFAPPRPTRENGAPPDAFIWDIHQRNVLKKLFYPRDNANFFNRLICIDHVCFSPDGEYLATGGAEGICLWNVTTGQEVWSKWSSGAYYITSKLCFTCNGEFLISGEELRGKGVSTIFLYETTAGSQKWKIGVHQYSITNVQWIDDKQQIVSGDRAGFIRFWQRSAYFFKNLNKSQAVVEYINFSPCGKYIFTIKKYKNNGLKYIYNISLSAFLISMNKITWEQNNIELSFPIFAIFSPDSSLIALNTYDGVILLDRLSGQVRRLILLTTVPTRAICFSHDGRVLIVLGKQPVPVYGRVTPDFYFECWDVQTGAQLRRIERRDQNFALVQALRVRIAALGLNGTVAVMGESSISGWDLNTGERIWTTPVHGFGSTFMLDQGVVVHYSYENRCINWYNTLSGSLSRSVKLPAQLVVAGSCCLSRPNGTHALFYGEKLTEGIDSRFSDLYSSSFSTLSLLDLENGQLLQKLTVPGRIFSLEYSPDGRFIASNANSDSGYRLWSVGQNGLITGLVYASSSDSLHIEGTSFQSATGLSREQIALISYHNRENHETTRIATHFLPRPPSPVPLPAGPPLDIARLERERAPKCWQADLSREPRPVHSYKILLNPGEVYRRIPASPEDVLKVTALYNQRPVPGFQIDSVHVIYNPVFEKNFKGHVKQFNERMQQEAFRPNWKYGYELEICYAGVPTDIQVRARPHTVHLYRQGNAFAYKICDSGHQNVTIRTLGNLSAVQSNMINILFPPRSSPLTRRHIDTLSSLTGRNGHPLRDLHFQRREQIIGDITNHAQPYHDEETPGITFLPLWHGTKRQYLDSICRTGYANLATTDPGYYGKGVYGTLEAKYAAEVYARNGGVLLLNWVAFHSAYPLVDHEDMDRLYGQPNYGNHDAHVAPVVPKNPNNPREVVYLPAGINRPAMYTEVVVFDSAAVLIRYEVTLKPDP